MPNALLSVTCKIRRTMPQGQCHFFVTMWRLRYATATHMGGRQVGHAQVHVHVHVSYL